MYWNSLTVPSNTFLQWLTLTWDVLKLTCWEKELLRMEAQRISSRFLLLTLETSSGTYIKEFVNSDFGRTKPSLANLLDPSGIPMECQLLQLDVVKVGDE